MGVTIREKPNGSGIYWLFINHQGKRKAKRVGDKKAAQALARQVEQRLAAKDLGILKEEKTVPLFKEYAEAWRKNMVMLIKRSTQILYDHLLDYHILPVFGDKRLDEITYVDVKNFILSKSAAGLAVSTLKSINAVVSGIYSSAIEDSVTAFNPSSRHGKLFSRLKKRETRFEINFLTKQEASLFLDTSRQCFPSYYPLFLCALRTGMRIGELIALEWGDVDFSGRFIIVRRSSVNGRIETPKNGKTRRVDMSQQLADTFSSLKVERKKQALKSGKSAIADRIFLSANGDAIDVHNFRHRVFHKLLDKAELRRIRIHDLRHTYASLLIAQNESLAYIRDQMGHHSINVTVDIYGHLVPGANKGAVDRLDDVFCPQQSATQAQPVAI